MRETQWINLDNGAKIRWGFVPLDQLLLNSSAEQLIPVFSLEVFIPKGPTFLYGGLEARDSTECEHRLSIDSSLGRAAVGALAGQADSVYWGLPTEFAESLLEAVSHSRSLWNLKLSNATYCNEGSSLKLFCILAKTIMAVTSLPSLDTQCVNQCILETFASGGALSRIAIQSH
jgi:hypothetical protein